MILHILRIGGLFWIIFFRCWDIKESNTFYYSLKYSFCIFIACVYFPYLTEKDKHLLLIEN